MNHQFTVEGLARPVSAKQTLSHNARTTVTPDNVVSFESNRPWLASLDVHPSSGVILSDIGNRVIEPDIDQPLAPLHAMFVHDLQNQVKRQNRHAVFLVLGCRQVNACQFLPRVLHIAPADIRKARNTAVSQILEQASTAKDSSRRDTVLGGSETLVEPIPGFQD